MRSAEKIIKEYRQNPQRSTYLELIKEIQKEAYKQGVWDTLEQMDKTKKK